MDSCEARWPAYEEILEQSLTWPVDCRPAMLPQDSKEPGKWPELDTYAHDWMEDAKRIAVAGYRQVLEDGPDVCKSEDDAEYSDHGEQWTYAEMYTPEMLGPNGKPKTNQVRLTTEHASALRAAGRSVPQAQSIPESRTQTPVPSDSCALRLLYHPAIQKR
jgi:hypothetical protein